MPREMLMEGVLANPAEGDAGCIMYPEVAYVVQPVMKLVEGVESQDGSRAFFFLGKPNQLNESLDTASVQIVENYDDLELIERELPNGQKTKLPKGGTIFVEGPYQRSDVENANKRTYSRKLWERLIGDPKSGVQTTVKERGMVGHLEHPADGRTHGKEVALLNSSLVLREDGVVWGKSELLDTPNGLILQEFTRKGVRWGVSSRGSGTVRSDGKVDENDFVLITFDAVMNPSTPGAYPSKVNDDKDKNERKSLDTPSVNVSEEVSEFLSESSRLSEVNVSDLTESGRNDYARELVALFLKGNRSSIAGVLTDEQRATTAKWLSNKLRESTEETAVGSVLDEAVAEAERVTEARSQAHVDSVRRQLAAALEEAETERARSGALAEEAESLRDQLAEAQAALTEAEDSCSDLQTRLSLAEMLIAEQSEQEVSDEIAAVVEAAIAEVPELGEYRDLLERCDTPSEARGIAERLIHDVAARKHEEASSSSRAFPTPRRNLPAGLIVESEAMAHKQTKSAPTSSGAKMAAQAMAAGKK